MQIILTDTKNGRRSQVLCDICNSPLELDESCDHLTPRIGGLANSGGASRPPHLRPRSSRPFPRFLVADGLAQAPSSKPFANTVAGPCRNTGGSLPPEHRHPQILKLLRDLKSEREGRIK